ncbi:hypothetical protein [Cupriavidus sp. Marseille-Q8015]
MGTEIKDDFDVMTRPPEIQGKEWVCEATCFVKAKGEPDRLLGTYEGRGKTAQKAENEARNKAKTAYYAWATTLPRTELPEL